MATDAGWIIGNLVSAFVYDVCVSITFFVSVLKFVRTRMETTEVHKAMWAGLKNEVRTTGKFYAGRRSLNFFWIRACHQKISHIFFFALMVGDRWNGSVEGAISPNDCGDQKTNEWKDTFWRNRHFMYFLISSQVFAWIVLMSPPTLDESVVESTIVIFKNHDWL